MKRSLLWLLPCLLATASAEDLTTNDGKTYKGVTVKKVEVDSISIIHEAGTAKVLFTNLPAEVQQKYGYDPAKAEAVAKEQAAKLDAARSAAKAKEAANEWSNRFLIEPEAHDQLTMRYTSFEEHVRINRAVAVRDKLSRIEIEESAKYAPKGGSIFATKRCATSNEAARHHFTILLFDREGNAIKTAREQTNFEVMKGPDGLWQKNVAVSLLGPLEAGDRIRIVDRLDNRHREFTVKAK